MHEGNNVEQVVVEEKTGTLILYRAATRLAVELAYAANVHSYVVNQICCNRAGD